MRPMAKVDSKNALGTINNGIIPWTKRLVRLLLFVPILASACKSSPVSNNGPRILQAGAPGQASRSLAPQEIRSIVQPTYHQADVDFMQGMIHHHNQALEMSALISDRTASSELDDLGRRITISQEDEIAFMQRWLADRGEANREEHMDHGSEHMPGRQMPGMLTPEEMSSLRNSNDEMFDRLFLEGMIKHHRGALIMVATLFNTSGAGLEPDIFQFAYHVDSDQYIEIERMISMLEARR